jgi:dienelactone hydrolase
MHSSLAPNFTGKYGISEPSSGGTNYWHDLKAMTDRFVRRRAFVALLSGWLFFTPVPVVGAPTEEAIRIPLTTRGLFGEQTVMLEATLYRPEGDGPFPLVVVNHGSPRNPALRERDRRESYGSAIRWFVTRGFVAVLPMRRGYAGTGGPWAEGYGRCNNPDYEAAGVESARDIRAVVDFMRSQPYIDDRRILLVGHSAGGFGALALASEGLDGILGVVNVAGGRGSGPSGHQCMPDRLVEATAAFARTVRVPTLWLYAENDLFFRPPLVRQMHEAFVKAGGDAELIFLEPSGKDGHGLFTRAGDAKLWTPAVDAFLRRLGFTLPPR